MSLSRKIVILHPSEQTNRGLNDWARSCGFDLSRSFSGKIIDEFDFHVTVIATENEVDFNNFDSHWPEIVLEPERFFTLGKNNEVPAIKIAHNWRLHGIWSALIQNNGFVPTFPIYLPHISLSYNWSGLPKLTHLRLPSFPLIFDRMTMEDFVP